MGHDPTHGSDQEVFKIRRVESGRVRRWCSSSRGSDRVGSEGFQNQSALVGPGQEVVFVFSRVESSRVRSCSKKLMGRLGSPCPGPTREQNDPIR